jgi:ABC-type dipeptide/oligopeptide/nickel transport system permease subunit
MTTGPLVVQAAVTASTAIISVAALSFFGLGAQPPAPEWGLMIREGREILTRAPHVLIFTGIAITVASFSFNLLAEALRDAMEIKTEI